MPVNTECAMNNGTPNPTMGCGAVTLNYLDTLTLTIGSGFPDPANLYITEIDFYEYINETTKGPLLGSWKRHGPYSMPNGVSGDAFGNGARLTDTDSGIVDDKYYYDVTAVNSVSHVEYHADPELVIRKRPKPPLHRAPRPSINPDV